MFTKLERTKVFRDPLYGYINVYYKLISDLIDSKEIQRLRRIRQLSGVCMVFQTAEHSRFTHSLGAYQMANLVITNVMGMNEISEYEKLVFLCSALLHDIGHGPYSHAFENVMEKSHEDMSVSLILSPLTDVNKILSINDNLANDIASVISHSGKFPLIESLVSSQLDVDRMDYLSRDAYFTGAAYGHIDYFRILRSMLIKDNQVMVRASGVHSIESYLMSRYHMYFQVYYHPVARSYECILEGIYARLKDLALDNKEIDASIDSFISVLKNNDNILEYINLDDSYVNDDNLKIEIHKIINQIDSLESLNDARRKIEDRFGKISENLEIYMYEELFESMRKKKGIEIVKQTDKYIELSFSKDYSNRIKADELFINAYKISRNFKLSYSNGRIVLTLPILNLDKHFIYYIIDLLNNL